MKPLSRLLSLAALLTLALSFTACTPEDIIDIFDDDEPETPVTPSEPDTPTDKNTVTVTPEGSKVTRGDFSINFPKGTFTEDVQVTVVDLKKGEVGGEHEASKFYKVTMPATTNKKLTIRLKSSVEADDVNFILHSPGVAISTGEERTNESYLDTRYADGEYSTTFPPFDNGDNPGNISFTIGLGHLPTLDNSGVKGTRTLGNLNYSIGSGQVDSVKWDVYVSWASWWKYDKASINKLKAFTPKLNTYIEEAIKQIHKLGFTLGSAQTIPIYYTNTLNWGEHSHSKVCRNWSEVEIGSEKVLSANPDLQGLRCTVIHELFHYYQTENYDPRPRIARGIGGDYLQLYEMGAVWIEKFVNGGQPSADFQISDGGLNKVKQYRMGFPSNESELNDLFDNMTVNPDAWQNAGYLQSLFLYYLTSQGSAYGFNDNSIIELYKKWGDISTLLHNYTSLEVLSNWTYFDHHWNILRYGDAIDTLYLKLFKGELVKGLNYSKLNKKDLSIYSKPNQKTFQGKIAPFGCEGQMVLINFIKDSLLTDKTLVIKQECEGVRTRLLITDKTSNFNTVREYPHVAELNDSIVLSGQELEAMRLTDGTLSHKLFLLTTKTSNGTGRGSAPSRVTVSLHQKKPGSGTVTPQELSFTAEGGMQTLKVTASGFNKFGFTISEEYKSWLSGKAVSGGTIEVTAQPNTSNEERTGYVKVYLTNEQNPTEAQKTYIGTVKVTQKGKATSEMIPVHVSFTMHLEKSRWTQFWNDGDTYTTTSILNWSQFYDQYRFYAFPGMTSTQYEFIEMTQDEHGVHFNCYITYTQGEKTHSTLTFDLDDLDKLADGTAVITNIQSEDEWNFGNQSHVSQLSTHAQFKMDAPLRKTSGPYDLPGWDGAEWELKGDAVQFDNLSQQRYLYGKLDGFYSDYISHPDNYISLFLSFLHNATASSAPRHRTPLAASSTSSARVQPGSDHGEAFLWP